MNGGRLSDDEVFLLGMEELRRQLASARPDTDAAQQALTRVALRFPDEAEELRAKWPQAEACRVLLDSIAEQHRLDSDADN